MPATSGTHQVFLRLAKLDELVVPPPIDPLSGRFEDRCGVERILDRLRAERPRRLDAIEARLVLDEMPGPEAKRRVDEALRARLLYRDERLGEEILKTRRDGVRALGKALLFMLACMVVSAVTRETNLLPDLLRELISEGFVIAGWVALWSPIELLLFEWLPAKRDRNLYRIIGEMTYTVEPAAASGGKVAPRQSAGVTDNF